MAVPEVTAQIAGGRVATYPYTDLPKAISLTGAATNGPILDWEWTIIPEDAYNPGGCPELSSLLSTTSGDFINGRANVQNPSITLDVQGGYKFSLRARNVDGWSDPSYVGDGLSAEAIVFITTPRGLNVPPANMFRYEDYLEAALFELESTSLQDAYEHGATMSVTSAVQITAAASVNALRLSHSVGTYEESLLKIISAPDAVGWGGAEFYHDPNGYDDTFGIYMKIDSTVTALAAATATSGLYIQHSGNALDAGDATVRLLELIGVGSSGATRYGLHATGLDVPLYSSAGRIILDGTNADVRLSARSAGPTNAAGKGFVYTKDVGSGVIELFYMDEAGNEEQLTPGSAVGNTLEASYDQGGAGAGRQIEATDGAVRIYDTAAANNNMLELEIGLGADSQVGLLSTVHHAGFNNSAAYKAIVDDTGGALTSGEIAAAFHALMQDNTADPGASGVAFLADTDHAFPGTHTAFRTRVFGAGVWTWALDADGGSVRLSAGHLRFGELLADPAQVANQGSLFVKDVSGVPELFYRDDTNAAFQLTDNGTPAGGGGGGGGSLTEEVITSATIETSKVLSSAPATASGALSGCDLQVFRNGVRMEYNAAPSTQQQFSYTSGTLTVNFLNAPGSRYDFVYRV